MYFITGLPRKPKGFDSIWVLVDQLTKSEHFLHVKKTYSVAKYAQIYIEEIVSLHGVHLSIISDQGPQFTSRSGKHYKKLWEPNLISVQHFIHRHIDNL